MDITSKDIVLVLAGFALSIVGSAIYGWWYSRSSQSKAEAKAFIDSLSERLNSADAIIRSDAFHEIAVKSSFWFILGNIMFAISGLAWVLDLTGVWPLQSILASATSFVAVFFFGASLKWLRLYMKIKFK